VVEARCERPHRRLPRYGRTLWRRLTQVARIVVPPDPSRSGRLTEAGRNENISPITEDLCAWDMGKAGGFYRAGPGVTVPAPIV
jgi:hypothetical protein